MIAAAFPPMPPLTERGASVFAPDPIRTPEFESLERIRFPVPAEVRVRLLFAVVLTIGLVPAKDTEAPLTVRFPPSVVNPVPVVTGALLVVLRPRRDGLLMMTLPVVAEPIVRVALFVVERTPSPVREVAVLPVPAERDAVGTPELILIKAIFEDAVAMPPSKRSWVVILSVIEPFCCSKGEPPFPIGKIPVISDDTRLTALEVRTPFVSEWRIPAPKPKTAILPVLAEPSVKVCLFVVPKIPLPER
jgi:hypothetical protein